MNARLLALPVLLLAATAGAAVTAAPGFAVHAIPTPATVAGGVVRVGDAIFVGQGPSFTANAQSVIRLAGGVATTIATGFSSLGGFAFADGFLYVVDNAAELPGATTGDTVYAIPDALARTTAVAAADVAVVPAGTIPSAFDVAVAPDGALLVSDAAGPGAGRVVRVFGGSATTFLPGFDYTGGLAIAGPTLFVGNVDGSFVGAVRRATLAGVPLPDLVGGLSGIYALDIESDGSVLATGGFADDFSSTVVAIASDGSSATERARGFAFTGELFFDAARDETLVLDFGVSDITAICRDGDADGVCDADDDCRTVADAGQADGDGDGIGDACDPCNGGVLGKARLALARLDNGVPDDHLNVSGTVAAGPGVLDAVMADGLRLRVHDTLDVTLPGGAFDPALGRGWKVRGRRIVWRDPAGTFAGIRRAAVATSQKQPGVARVTIAGKRVAYPLSLLDLPPTRVGINLGSAGGACGEATFDRAACKADVSKGALACH